MVRRQRGGLRRRRRIFSRLRAEGWRLAGSGEDVHIFVDAAGTAKEIEDGDDRGLRAPPLAAEGAGWAGLAAFYLLLYAIMRLCGDGFDLMRSGVLGGLFLLVYPAMMLAGAAIVCGVGR